MITLENIALAVETARAWAAAAWATAMGNPTGAAAIAILVSAGVYGGISALRSNSTDDSPAGQRPVRRDDVENLFKRQMGWGVK